MGQHFLFMSHPDHGHVLPNLAVVTALVDRGHRVTYLTGETMVDLVTEAGATPLVYDSRYRQANFTDVAYDPLYLMTLLLSESASMLAKAEEQLGDDRPDAVSYDISMLYAGRILSRKWDIPAVQLIPMFASNGNYSYINSIYNSDGAEKSMPDWVGEQLARIGELMAVHGIEGSPQELWWEVPDFSVVNIPQSFQIEGDTFDERFAFVGPCLGRRAFFGEWSPPDNGLPIVLISFGAVFNEHSDFFHECVRAFTGMPWHAVITVAGGMDPADLGPLPPNVEVHRFVPHVAVLEHAQIAVTHGGMGTVMEALHTGTPMVVVPTSSIDGVTADRLAELNLGRTMKPEEVTAQRLIDAVLAVAADETIKRSTEEMREQIKAAGGATRAADEIEKYLARTV
ncbi:macrolide family glycosyltransferase [Actinoalloteichus hymeniacidonis]|uniref:Glycosyltransferase, MGT family n=1 Tax=Actinoalloteichus hymeniacidonis TaxID=340345 RepID=A0AAC9HMC8_9PSEU|nr:macrolide family glycosyltransferase [Actinoalloteichus hymeniacidonis]AOS61954.1 glycosyltransferase, MGT family [Actinoalloteichus hymeniacidonis]MBB5910024.1 dTDP-L-oleandrosyltransferase [Actinoalloteichus hymeniacidonis]